MKNLFAILMATAMILSAVPAFACDGHGGGGDDETTTTSTNDSKKDKDGHSCGDAECACDKGAKADKKKENAS